MAGSNLLQHISAALAYRYSSASHISPAIESCLKADLTADALHFREVLLESQEEEYLKRVYQKQEHRAKMEGLTEYYKFTRHLPTVHNKEFQGTIQRYYDKLREMDYRKIKAIVKKEQNISLTTQHNDSSFFEENGEQKSAYSNILYALDAQQIMIDNGDESIMLNGVCHQIGEAFKHVQIGLGFKPCKNNPDGKKFEQFLQKSNKFHSTLRLKKERMLESVEKGSIAAPRKCLKDTKGYLHAKESSEKTTVNETVSREERWKKQGGEGKEGQRTKPVARFQRTQVDKGCLGQFLTLKPLKKEEVYQSHHNLSARTRKISAQQIHGNQEDPTLQKPSDQFKLKLQRCSIKSLAKGKSASTTKICKKSENQFPSSTDRKHCDSKQQLPKPEMIRTRSLSRPQFRRAETVQKNKLIEVRDKIEKMRMKQKEQMMSSRGISHQASSLWQSSMPRSTSKSSLKGKAVCGKLKEEKVKEDKGDKIDKLLAKKLSLLNRR